MDIETAAENAANRQMVADEWNLGPQVASVKPKANVPFWRDMAARWQVEPDVARRRLCANCEYFDNTEATQADMEAIPLDGFDVDGGGRGYCVKFDFICHNLRTCQAWEGRDFTNPDGSAKWVLD